MTEYYETGEKCMIVTRDRNDMGRAIIGFSSFIFNEF